jgi:hypothetical protein
MSDKYTCPYCKKTLIYTGKDRDGTYYKCDCSEHFGTMSLNTWLYSYHIEGWNFWENNNWIRRYSPNPKIKNKGFVFR